jgi:hypothetical protein
MNVEIGAEAAQFPEKEYINGIAVADLQCRLSDGALDGYFLESVLFVSMLMVFKIFE